MADRIEILDTNALSDLRGELERFIARVRSAASGSQTATALVMRRFATIIDDHRRRVATARVAAAAADDDDWESAESELKEAEERLRAAQGAIDDACRTFARLQRSAAAADQAMASAGSTAAEYLGVKIGQLRALRNLTPEQFGPALPATPDEARAGRSKRAGAAAPDWDELQAFRLPIGWHWVRLDEIDTGLRPGETLDFAPGQREGLIDCYRRLLVDILPMLDRNRDAAHDRFARDDLANGIHDQSGKRGAFDAFFQTGEPIHLQRDSARGLWVADSGRHRIEVARSLGWSAVPAQRQGP
jgi:hypothetical protein